MIYIYWKKEFLYLIAFIFINSIFHLFDLNHKMIEKEINLCKLIDSFSQICLFIPFLIEYKISQKKRNKNSKRRNFNSTESKFNTRYRKKQFEFQIFCLYFFYGSFRFYLYFLLFKRSRI